MIKVFVGCAPNHDDLESQAVLEWSIRKHASLPVEITWMRLSRDPASPFYGWATASWATPFTGFRWAVPELCGFEGRAIYMDSDFIVLADLAELWDQELQSGKVVMAKGGGHWRLCLSMWDCAAAQPYMVPVERLKADSANHQRMAGVFHGRSNLIQPFRGDWNCLDARDGEKLADVKALHYTRMSTQPHLEYAIPRLQAAGLKHWYNGRPQKHLRQDVRQLFAHTLTEAITNGFPPERYAQHEPFGKYPKQKVG